MNHHEVIGLQIRSQYFGSRISTKSSQQPGYITFTRPNGQSACLINKALWQTFLVPVFDYRKTKTI